MDIINVLQQNNVKINNKDFRLKFGIYPYSLTAKINKDFIPIFGRRSYLIRTIEQAKKNLAKARNDLIDRIFEYHPSLTSVDYKHTRTSVIFYFEHKDDIIQIMNDGNKFFSEAYALDDQVIAALKELDSGNVEIREELYYLKYRHKVKFDCNLKASELIKQNFDETVYCFNNSNFYFKNDSDFVAIMMMAGEQIKYNIRCKLLNEI